MLFSIDEDAGHRIVGWIMPDNPSTTPSVVVFVKGEKQDIVTASVLRPLLREQGLHATGICGFVIDERRVPGLGAMQEVELYDLDTNIRIYRRRPATALIDAKIFRLETSTVPQNALNDSLEQLCHMSFERLERLPEEAIRSVLSVSFTTSIFATGRLYLPNYEALLDDRGFKKCAVIRDPVDELAETLLVLRAAAETADFASSGIVDENLVPLVHSLASTPMTDYEQFQPWLAGLPMTDRFPLTNSLTRLLTCRSSEDAPESAAVGAALDILSDMHVVGLQSDQKAFRDSMAATLGSPLIAATDSVSSPITQEFSAQLRTWPITAQLLSVDLELFADLQGVFQRVDEALSAESAGSS